MKYGYKAGRWATYQQWQELGAQVRKGEKSTAVVFWKFYGADEEAEASEDGTADSQQKRCFARAYHVFNAAQVDGYNAPTTATLPERDRIQHAEAFFRNTGLTIVEGGSEAYYSVKSDEIHMPPFSAFKKADFFYSVLSHEAVHNAARRIMPR